MAWKALLHGSPSHHVDGGSLAEIQQSLAATCFFEPEDWPEITNVLDWPGIGIGGPSEGAPVFHHEKICITRKARRKCRAFLVVFCFVKSEPQKFFSSSLAIIEACADMELAEPSRALRGHRSRRHQCDRMVDRLIPLARAIKAGASTAGYIWVSTDPQGRLIVLMMCPCRMALMMCPCRHSGCSWP
jgi:hypothetical protein